jgi:hypothetical protein
MNLASLAAVRAGWRATELLTFVAHRNGLTVKYSDPELATNSVRFKCSFDDVETAPVAEWALYFLNANAVVEGGTMTVSAGKPSCPPQTDLSAVTASLAQPLSQTNSFSGRLDQMIEYVMHVGRVHNVLMGPECPEFFTKVKLKPSGRSTAEILKDLCDQAKLEYSVHDKIVFIRKKTKEGLPNQRIDRDKK